MKRCTVIIPDAGPFNSLWVADQLPLLLRLEMPIVVLDAVYDEMTSDPEHFAKDRDVKNFIDQHRPPFILETTETGREERIKRREGRKLRKNAGEVAITDFMSDGLERYAGDTDPVIILFEDADIPMVRFFRKPPNLHLLSTIGMLRGLEKVGVIQSSEEIVHSMTHPADPTKRPRVFNDLPEGTDDPAAMGSKWTP